MILKYFAFGIAFCTCTFFAAEKNGRMVKFENKSRYDLVAYYYNEKGNNAHLTLKPELNCESKINRAQQNIVVTWSEHDLQHKFSFQGSQDIIPTLTVFPAIALKIGQQPKEKYIFLAPELSNTDRLNEESSSSSSSE